MLPGYDWLLVYILLTTSVASYDKEESCTDDWHVFENSCYQVRPETVSWHEARDNCQGDGADLVVISSSSENDFLLQMLRQMWPPVTYAWIGFTDVKGQWNWVNTNKVDDGFTAWAFHSPDNNRKYYEDCAAILPFDIRHTDRLEFRGWVDIKCSTAHYVSFICEKDMVSQPVIGIQQKKKLDALLKMISNDDADGSTNTGTRLNKSNKNVIPNVSILSMAADVIWNMTEVHDGSSEVTDYIVKTVSNIMRIADTIHMDKSSSDITSKIVISLEGQLSNNHEQVLNFTYTEPNIAVKGVTLHPLESTDITDISKTTYMIHVYEDIVLDVPLSVVASDIVELKLSVGYYIKPSLFVSPSSSRILSGVVYGHIEGRHVNNLPQPVLITFSAKHLGKKILAHQFQCVYWDFGLMDGHGDWSNIGCKLHDVTNGIVTCGCNHLTNFAVLMDPAVDTIPDAAISFMGAISFVGCAFSIACLVLTIATFLAYRKLRRTAPQQMLINLSLSLLLLYTTFVIGINRTNNLTGCLFSSILLHYFLLSTLLWMSAEAVNLYMNLIEIFNSTIGHLLIKASIICWGFPLAIIIVTYLIDNECYWNQSYCFMKSGRSMYYGVLLPTSLLISFNIIIFVLLIWRLKKSRFPNCIRSSEEKWREHSKRMKNAVMISVLLGLTWTFGLCSMAFPGSVVFDVLFCVFNTFHGCAIFVLFVALNDEIRQLMHSSFSKLFHRNESEYRPVSSSHGARVNSQNTRLETRV